MHELQEMDHDKLLMMVQKNDLVVAVAHTPTCGTCTVAKKMLMIIQATLEHVPIVSINLNLNETLAMEQEIMSVPCILIYKNKICIEKIYAFESVPFLYKKITSYL
ncbi:MAG: thioredoxin family protein [Turicibacter sp.]